MCKAILKGVAPWFALRTEKDYDRAVKRLNQLLDEVGTNEYHPLYELLDTLGTVIHAYEEQHYLLPNSSGAEMLRFFMDEHGFAPSDLPELGSPGIVKEILEGTRDLTVKQIRAIAERFHVSPGVFI